VNVCARPLDPIDVEALAAGAEPIAASDAADHARDCPACADRVSQASELANLEIPADKLAGPDLADRILRLRAFSRRERLDFSLWRGACGLAAAVFLGGLLLLTLPGLTAREQASLGLATVTPLWTLWKSLMDAAGQTAAAAPSGIRALCDVMRHQQTLGLAALALLAPVLLGLRRATARARR
jgi:hypothetical protein